MQVVSNYCKLKYFGNTNLRNDVSRFYPETTVTTIVLIKDNGSKFNHLSFYGSSQMLYVLNGARSHIDKKIKNVLKSKVLMHQK